MTRKPHEPKVTEGGTVLTDREVDRIVAEVDDAVSLGRVDISFPRKGRPSLSGDNVASPHVGFRISPEFRKEVAALAQRQGVTVSALARQALEEYVARTG